MKTYKLFYEKKSLTSYLVNATKRYLKNLDYQPKIISLAKRKLKDKLKDRELPELANLCRRIAYEMNEKIRIWHSYDSQGNIKGKEEK